MTEGVPLVIPEVNPEAMSHVKLGQGAIIANPNCSTIIALMAVTPLHRCDLGSQAAVLQQSWKDVSAGGRQQPSIFEPVTWLCSPAAINI
jgi:aspartate-semialdehyde dehydrogenase